jgi:hypothetical protein
MADGSAQNLAIPAMAARAHGLAHRHEGYRPARPATADSFVTNANA